MVWITDKRVGLYSFHGKNRSDLKKSLRSDLFYPSYLSDRILSYIKLRINAEMKIKDTEEGECILEDQKPNREVHL